jgi:hypothetical protein
MASIPARDPRPAVARPGADPHEQHLARLRTHVLTDVLAGRSLEDVDAWLGAVAGLGQEEHAALWLYGWVSADSGAQPGRHQRALGALV